MQGQDLDWMILLDPHSKFNMTLAVLALQELAPSTKLETGLILNSLYPIFHFILKSRCMMGCNKC